MTIRDIRQKEFADIFLQERRNGILYLCPRFGKCRVGINIFSSVIEPKILIAYPDVNIKKSWTDEFEEMSYINSDIEFTTHLSLKKFKDNNYDLIVIDEIHLLSKAQIEIVKYIKKRNIRILGLTGTLSKQTKNALKKSLGLDVLATYTMEQAIIEGIITDYRINVKRIPLNDRISLPFGKKKRTEKRHFDAYSYIIDKLQEEGKDTMFPRLARMRLIQNSYAKIEATKDILKKCKDERILVFCGLTDISDKLGCPSFHSKKTKEDKKVFDDFAQGIGDNHIAVVKIGNTGKTYKPLNKVVINYFDTNPENLAQKIFRCMAMEYNNLNKKSDIWIISTDEKVELDWLKSSLEFFDQKKIVYC